ncbi:MAG: pyrroline-5-carboxylate reductase [Firmicutes bacterium]|nr:pyrroline-5-carboxylate reductase [Bacillota bacterium]
MFGLIGCGTMGGALLSGIIYKELVDKNKFVVFDLDEERANSLKEKLGVKVAPDLRSFCQQAQKIFLAVKPQDMKDLLGQIKSVLNPGHLLISLAAGLTIAFFEKYLGKPLKMIRLMPNTPCLVGAGMIAVCRNDAVTAGELQEIAQLLESLGRIVFLEEKHMGAVTGLSGSGPAYVFFVIEALADGGVEMGLDRDTALLLAAQTVFGAAKMVLDTKEHPALLKNKVTSPGGTTSAGLFALEKGALRATFIKAVAEAAKRENNLSRRN